MLCALHGTSTLMFQTNLLLAHFCIIKMNQKQSENIAVSLDELKQLIQRGLKQLGYTSEESQVIERVLLYAELRGNTQGVVKLVTNSLNKPKYALPPISIDQQTNTPVSATINGNEHCGMLVLDRATEIAAQKAKINGISIVTCHNYCKLNREIAYKI